jgi:hypothetical protein
MCGNESYESKRTEATMRLIVLAFIAVFGLAISGCASTAKPSPSFDQLNEIALDYLRANHPSWQIAKERDPYLRDKGPHWEWSFFSMEVYPEGDPCVYIDKETLKVIKAERR